ncbi:MAG: ATP-binding protein [Candidatus Berkelbacteria bacterium]
MTITLLLILQATVALGLFIFLYAKTSSTKNYLIPILNVGIAATVISTISEMLFKFMPNITWLYNIFRGGEMVMILSILVMFVAILNHCKDKKSVLILLVIASALLEVLYIMQIPSYEVTSRIVEMASVVILTLIIWSYIKFRQSGILYFIAYLILVATAGVLAEKSQVMYYLLSISSLVVLFFGIATNKVGSKSETESLFGAAPKSFSRIRPRIILTFGFSFIILSIASTYIVIAASEKYLRSEIDLRINTLAESNVTHVTMKLSEQKNTVELMAKTSQAFVDYLKNPNQATNSEIFNEVQKKLINIKSNSLDFQEVFLIDSTGKEVASSSLESIGQDKSSDEIFIQGIKNTHIKDVYYSDVSKEHSMAISVPVTDSGKTFGVIAARVDIHKFFAGLVDSGKSEAVDRIFVMNSSGYLISQLAEYDNGEILKTKLDADPPKACLAEIAKNKSSYLPQIIVGKSIVNTTVIASYLPIKETNWCVIVAEKESTALASTNSEIQLFILLLLGSVVIFYIVGYYFSTRITKPIEELKFSAEKIAAGDLSQNVIINSNDEIGQLSQSFDAMIKAVIASRAEVDRKVEEQTHEITEKSAFMEDQQKAVLNILEDVEDEKDKVGHEKDKIDAILHSIGDGVFVVDKDLNIIVFNSVAAKLSGYSVEESMGKKYSDVLKFSFEDTGKVNDEFMSKAMTTGEVQEMANHTQITQKAGEKIAVADSAAPLKDRDGSIIGCVVVFRDVTHEREIDKAKTEFVSLASHQLRTPLSSVNWFAEMLLAGDAGKLTKQQTEFVEKIYAGNQRMVDLVNSLLNVSRIELGTFSVEPEPTDVVEISKSVIEELTPQIKTKKLKIKENYEKIPKFSADPKLVRIVLQNLLSNAVKYTPDGGSVESNISLKDKNILINVKDSGYGIPKDQQDKIFSKLFRADNVREKDTEGTGLGLYIVKSIVDNSGGKISFDSAENKGTTFHVALPLSGMKAKEGDKRIE